MKALTIILLTIFQTITAMAQIDIHCHAITVDYLKSLKLRPMNEVNIGEIKEIR